MSRNMRPEQLCVGLTEQGKLLTMSKDYTRALKYFQEAVRMAAQSKLGDIFLYNATRCVIEVLDLSNEFDLICQYCENAEHQFDQLQEHPVVNAMRAENLESLGLALVAIGQSDAAIEVLQLSADLDASNVLTVGRQVQKWLNAGFQIDMNRISSLKKTTGYYKITTKNARPELAIELPHL